ncbi:hypothetical protein WH52_04825 [Tenacibaculum holothuriorum]|uniref:Uncharacterized protein n=1 Tax=Tenacibaculum holothuriorum TaxID=1635173 RepID=A0A1Y2PH32_9FLAO|nr:hypothetical protein [Tenacibaculum holothuriorum]OSY88988.1 hypothetical protein WH52_04825 [Tenacibaculum holothuriorum]
MKQDIRTLFKDIDSNEKELPKNHRDDFIIKLNKNSSSKRKLTKFIAAASVLLIFSLFLFWNSDEKQEPTHQLITHVKQIEDEYLQNIDTEWNRFIELTNDQKLISKYKVRLDKLSNEYSKISADFSKNPNNINILEKLINNLKYRLQILKDIKEHINLLNQKNNTYETIIL